MPELWAECAVPHAPLRQSAQVSVVAGRNRAVRSAYSGESMMPVTSSLSMWRCAVRSWTSAYMSTASLAIPSTSAGMVMRSRQNA